MKRKGDVTVSFANASGKIFGWEMHPTLRFAAARVSSFRSAKLLLMAWSVIHFGGLIAAPAPAQPPLTHDSLQALVAGNKISADQAKVLQVDLDYVAATEKKLADFRSQTPPAQLNRKPSSITYQSLLRELEMGQHRLASDQAKFMTPAKPTPTPKPKR